MIRLSIILYTLLIVSCTKPITTIETEYDVYNRPIKTTETLTAREYAEIQKVKAVEASNTAYHNSRSKMFENIDSEHVPLLFAIMGLSPDTTPTNYNDVELARLKASVEKHKTWSSFFKFGAGAITAGYVGNELVEGLRTGGKAIEVIGNNNQIRGANTGNNGQASYSEQTAPFGGIPVNNADVSPISLGSDQIGGGCESLGGSTRPATEEEITNGLDSNGVVCSDGNGGLL